MTDPEALGLLARENSKTSWAHQRWPYFSENREAVGNLAILPLYGFQDWAPDFPLDIEELVGSQLLSEAMESLESEVQVITLPPVRFLFRGSEKQFFGSDPETIHLLFEEILQSVSKSGFRKVVLFNTNPWNEPFIDVVARDARIAYELQMFCINLSGIGLSFHPDSGEAARSVGQLCMDRESPDASFGRKLRSLLQEILERPVLKAKGAIPEMGKGAH